jgi:hypothetical protein
MTPRILKDIALDGTDFDYLCRDAQRWSTLSRSEGEFSTFGDDSVCEIFTVGYTLEDRASAILAHAYLEAVHESHQLVEHHTDSGTTYVILTDYRSPGRGEALFVEDEDDSPPAGTAPRGQGT